MCKTQLINEFSGQEGDEERSDDTDIVPVGKVSERTNAFENKPSESSEKLSQGPVLKRSESNLNADMQKKYQVYFYYLKYMIRYAYLLAHVIFMKL